MHDHPKQRACCTYHNKYCEIPRTFQVFFCHIISPNLLIHNLRSLGPHRMVRIEIRVFSLSDVHFIVFGIGKPTIGDHLPTNGAWLFDEHFWITHTLHIILLITIDVPTTICLRHSYSQKHLDTDHRPPRSIPTSVGAYRPNTTYQATHVDYASCSF